MKLNTRIVRSSAVMCSVVGAVVWGLSSDAAASITVHGGACHHTGLSSTASSDVAAGGRFAFEALTFQCPVSDSNGYGVNADFRVNVVDISNSGNVSCMAVSVNEDASSIDWSSTAWTSGQADVIQHLDLQIPGPTYSGFMVMCNAPSRDSADGFSTELMSIRLY